MCNSGEYGDRAIYCRKICSLSNCGWFKNNKTLANGCTALKAYRENKNISDAELGMFCATAVGAVQPALRLVVADEHRTAAARLFILFQLQFILLSGQKLNFSALAAAYCHHIVAVASRKNGNSSGKNRIVEEFNKKDDAILVVKDAGFTEGPELLRAVFNRHKRGIFRHVFGHSQNAVRII